MKNTSIDCKFLKLPRRGKISETDHITNQVNLETRNEI